MVLFIIGGFVRFKAFGIDPPLPVPARLADVVKDSPFPDRFSVGLLPLRLGLMMPMVLSPWFIRPRSWLRLFTVSPLGWYGALLVWAVITLPFSLSPRDVAISTFILISVSAFVVWYVDEFGWIPFVRVISATIGSIAVLSVIWGLVVPSEAISAGRLTGIALVSTHLGEASGLVIVLLLAHRGAVFTPRVTVLLVAFSAICVVWTQTRGAMGALVIAGGWWLVRPGRRATLGMVFAVFLVTPILIFTSALDAPVASVAREGDDIGLSGRLGLWQLAVDDADDLALTGTGYGLTFGGQSDFLGAKTSAGQTHVPLTYLHNLLVGAFTIYGVVGLALTVMTFARLSAPARVGLGNCRSTILVYFVATGISEAVILDAPIRASALVFVAVLASVATESASPHQRREGGDSCKAPIEGHWVHALDDLGFKRPRSSGRATGRGRGLWGDSRAASG